MGSTEIIKELVERKTYFKSKFIGKYWADSIDTISDANHEFFYSIKIYEGEVLAKKSDFIRWQYADTNRIALKEDSTEIELPSELYFNVTNSYGESRKFIAKVHEPKLSHYELSNKQKDDDQAFGTIEGLLTGYIVHYDEVEKEIYVEYPETDSTSNSIRTAKKRKVYKTNQLTGRQETDGNYRRYEYYYSDFTTYWGPWEQINQYSYLKSDSGFSIWKYLFWILLLLFFAGIVFPIIINNWREILVFVTIYLLFLGLSFARSIIRFIASLLFPILATAFLATFLFAAISAFFSNSAQPIPTESTIDSTDELTVVEPDPVVPTDSLIAHRRVWKDYRNRRYDTYLKVSINEFKKSTAFRNNNPYPITSNESYNRLIQDLYHFDQQRIPYIYAAFDSIRRVNRLNEYEFAEMVVSCIQDIPYVLLLDKQCNSNLYNDNFINNYLADGGKCDGNIRYGIRNPTEFIATLNGDCDTRTLLAFTVLNHFKYDVAILGSDVYSHSILGINLPYRGVSKNIRGKRYAVWETTSPNMRPGELPNQISNMQNWSVNIISN